MALKPLARVVKELNKEDIRTAYKELYEWKYQTGILTDGVVRAALKRLEELTGAEQDLRVIEDAILYEIAWRYVDITR